MAGVTDEGYEPADPSSTTGITHYHKEIWSSDEVTGILDLLPDDLLARESMEYTKYV